MISDLNRLEFDLTRAGLLVAHRASVIIRRTGAAVVRDAQMFCPVDTGFLRDSIGFDMDHDSMGFEAGPTAWYGRYVEEGTSRMAPSGYLGPAFDRNVPGAVTALGLLGGRLL